LGYDVIEKGSIHGKRRKTNHQERLEWEEKIRGRRGLITEPKQDKQEIQSIRMELKEK